MLRFSQGMGFGAAVSGAASSNTDLFQLGLVVLCITLSMELVAKRFEP